MNGRNMWAGIKEKVNDVKRTDCPLLISIVIKTPNVPIYLNDIFREGPVGVAKMKRGGFPLPFFIVKT